VGVFFFLTHRGGGERGAGRTVDLRARLGRQRLGDIDRLTQIVLDPDGADTGLRQQLGVAGGEAYSRAQEGCGTGWSRDDIPGQFDAVADLA
jgi:hypothetical protein